MAYKVRLPSIVHNGLVSGALLIVICDLQSPSQRTMADLSSAHNGGHLLLVEEPALEASHDRSTWILAVFTDIGRECIVDGFIPSPNDMLDRRFKAHNLS